MKRSGIYQIQIGPWFYYGQSIQLETRKSVHLSTLQANKHKNSILQNAYNKYQQFEFIILGELPVEELDSAEQFFIDCFHGTEHCANIASFADAPSRGRKASDETKAKMKASQQGNNIGRRRPTGAGAPSKPVELNGILYPSIAEAARQLGIPYATLQSRLKVQGLI